MRRSLSENFRSIDFNDDEDSEDYDGYEGYDGCDGYVNNLEEVPQEVE